MKQHEIIALMRRVKGWTQAQMAEQLDMSINGYSKIERGETSVSDDKREKLAHIFNVEPQDFFNFDGKVILNLINFNDQSNNNKVVTVTSIVHCQDELEKANLIIEQKDKEIAYLKEILSLKETLLKQN
jgi:transcriptional regulator with XRE-family HTH domain